MGMTLTSEVLASIDDAAYQALENQELSKGEHNRLLALVKACSGVRADLVRSESQAKIDQLKK